jgi:two-component system, chemotaxis family, sensor kinase Cph1
LNEKLTVENEEIENISWISSHDLKEPLRKIQILASRVLSSEAQNLAAPLLDSINRMHNSAMRMQNLLDNISAYSHVTTRGDSDVYININDVLDRISQEKQKIIRQYNAQIQYTSLPALQGVPFQITQLFVNLINNVLKFGRTRPSAADQSLPRRTYSRRYAGAGYYPAGLLGHYR